MKYPSYPFAPGIDGLLNLVRQRFFCRGQNSSLFVAVDNLAQRQVEVALAKKSAYNPFGF